MGSTFFGPVDMGLWTRACWARQALSHILFSSQSILQNILSILQISFSFLHLLHLQTTNIAAAPTNETDRLALLKFKQLIANDPHKTLSSWNDSIHFCNWHGVTCSHQHQRVTALNLHGYTLHGSISPYVGNLSFLKLVNLCDNTLYGDILQEVSHLFRLKDLLSNNSLTGRIPGNLTNCPELRVIDFTRNKICGNIPVELGSLKKLAVLQIGGNNLTGGISPSLGNIFTTLECQRGVNYAYLFVRVLGPFYTDEVLPPFRVEQASHPCRASLSSLQSKFSETWWTSLSLCPVRGPREGWALPSLDLWTWAYWARQWAHWARQALSHILSSSLVKKILKFYS